MSKPILVYIHRNIFYKHNTPYNATMGDASAYIRNKGENPEDWNIISFAIFDTMLNDGSITPETPVHFIGFEEQKEN